jgi:flagellar P-ring protein precursor FlgI
MSLLNFTLLKKTLLALLVLALLAEVSVARTLVKHIARLKGQEEITIQGMGLVIGLNGSGDGAAYAPTLRGLAAMLAKMNTPLGERGLAELKEAKNVALVMVTATIPASGARQGDHLECIVSSIGAAKSLEHGYLVTTALLSPQVGNDRVYGIAQGPLSLDNPRAKTVARIRQGCRLEEDFLNSFIKDQKITLVLNKSHADFEVAQEMASLINNQLGSYLNDSKFEGSSSSRERQPIARARDQVNIEIMIPRQYQDDPVDFVAQVMSIQMIEPQTGGRVIINERAGSIVISGEVEVGSVAVTHNNLVIETPGVPPTGSMFVGVETTPKPTAKLKSLVEALNALKVPAADQITIIKGIERDGKLHGTLVIE